MDEKTQELEQNQQEEQQNREKETNKDNSLEERENKIAEREKQLEEQARMIELKEIELIVQKELKDLDFGEQLQELFVNATMMVEKEKRYAFVVQNVEILKREIKRNADTQYQKDSQKLIRGITPQGSTGVSTEEFSYMDVQVRNALS